MNEQYRGFRESLLYFCEVLENRTVKFFKMKQKIILCIATVLWPLFTMMAQDNDPVLFELGDQEVRVSEFLYIYGKNNGKEADYSRKSLEEYLDLYVKFKMKVARARELQLDTIPELQRELAGYRQQLAGSYLTDKEVVERLSRELYERQQEDVDISHILINVPAEVTGDDTLAYYKRINALHRQLEQGADFGSLAREHSEDTYTAEQGGRLGYITAKMPEGFYAVETAAYTVPVGAYSPVVRSRLGYHIVQVNNRRPARGELEVSHILVRKTKREQEDPIAKAKIDRIYQQLQDGANFEVLAKAESDDNNTSEKGGYIGFFGINMFESDFEEAAFALEKDQQYTKPVESSIGWHIIKRISKKPTIEYEKQRRKLQEEIRRDERFELAETAMINKIKERAGFYENRALLDSFVDMLNEDFYSINWTVPAEVSHNRLMRIGDRHYSLHNFADYAKSNTRTRLRLSKETPLREAVNMLYREFVDARCIQYEEAMLEENHPDFRALMREYEEGILLFEATKIHVWDKAANDSTGLSEFFMKNRDRYRWDERAEVLDITIKADNEKKAGKIAKYIKKRGIDKAVKKYNKKETVITFSRKLAEEKAKKDYEPLPFEAGASTDLLMNGENQYRLKMVAKLIKPERKTMDEARGYIIADYQDELERQWIEELRKQYELDLNRDVFEGLIQ